MDQVAPSVVLSIVSLALFVAGIVVGVWGIRAIHRLLSTPCSADQIPRGHAYLLIAVTFSGFFGAPFFALGALMELAGEQWGALNGIIVGLGFGILMGLAAGSTVLSGRRFRYLVRWTRKKLGIRPIV